MRGVEVLEHADDVRVGLTAEDGHVGVDVADQLRLILTVVSDTVMLL